MPALKWLRQGNLSGKGEAGGRPCDISEDLQRPSESTVQRPRTFQNNEQQTREVPPDSGGSCSEWRAPEGPERTAFGVSSGGNFPVFVERLEM